MELKPRVTEAINKQINAEMWSSNLYLSMSMHFAHVGLNGFAHWMKLQSQEEMHHAYEMMEYLNKRGGQVKILAVNEVPCEFGTPLEIMEQVYAHECKVSELIEQLVSVAHEERDMPTQDFFWGFIREQVEEEATCTTIIDQLRLVQGHNIIFIDKNMGKRQA